MQVIGVDEDASHRRGGILEYFGRAYIPQATHQAMSEESQEQEEK